MAQFTAGTRFGAWELIQIIEAGGNGEVWKARGADGTVRAMKLLTKPKASAFQRFLGEIKILREHADIPGLLPIIDSHVPESFAVDCPPWFVMPLADSLKRYLREGIRVIVEATAHLADTLAALHGRGVSHRDLKPNNLLFCEGRPRVGDFGIAEYPDQPDLTGNSDLGPKWTIAPEMKRSPKTADGAPADVYSLAKTLWILLTRVEKGFEGQYLPGRAPTSLAAYWPDAPLLALLERALEQATSNLPADRPSMADFAEQLRAWLKQSADYRQTSLTDWRLFQEHIFPRLIPERAEWRGLSDMITVLNLLGQHAELNHTFHPDGGGLDLQGAAASAEDGCLELRFHPRIAVVIRPLSFHFESFPGFDDWAYFRLETAELAPSGVYRNLQGTYEELLELSPGRYLSRDLWERGFLEDPETGTELPFPQSARVVSRQFRGAFVVFAKASVYNEIDPYQGHHAKVSSDTFRRQIEDLLRTHGQRLRRPRSD